MSRRQNSFKKITRISQKIAHKCLQTIEKKIVWLLRLIFGLNRRREPANAGFVLPTVVMVSIVVVLMTTAIMFRSFDRAKNASNVRVNEAVLSAATPAIDRGRAKLNKLFQDKRLPRATPTDDALYSVLTEKLPEYTFGDETPLTLTEPGNNANELETAWQFPVDTDNNGKFDSYTLYGIYFKTPPVGSNNKYSRARNPLEARTPPMVQGTLDASCGANTSAVLVGNTGWIKQNNELKKSFFVYTATVPITNPPDTTNYERYSGNNSFAAVEYQQDRVQIPPNNYAVVYEDDLELTPGAAFKLNGAIFTNSNFLTTGTIKLYQVSALKSCFYEPSNAKIVVGGNLAVNKFTSSATGNTSTTKVDVFRGKTTTPTEKTWIRSVKATPEDTAYNNRAYVNRINRLVDAQMLNDSDSDPSEVQNGIAKKKSNLGLSNFTATEEAKIRRQQLELYFKRRTRRVPFAEVPFSSTDTDPTPDPLLQGSGDRLRPNDFWIYPTDPEDGKTQTNYANLELNITSTSLEPKATEPKELKKNSGREEELGDRVLAGNNLPELWWDSEKEEFVGSGVDHTQKIDGIKWDKPTGTEEIRTRRSLVQTLADVGSTERDGDWELDAAREPGDPTEPVGGLRVITGAGIYLNESGTPSSFDNTNKTIWPDTMPVPGTAPAQKTIKPYWMYSYMGGNGNAIGNLTYTWAEPANANVPRLKMRATAVYHYKSADYDAKNPTPIACVSSYYVPTNSTTAKNISTLPNANGIAKDTNGKSNNGIVYPAPDKTFSDYETVLRYQSQLTYPNTPNPRSIDDGLLARAIAKLDADDELTLSEQSAIDAQICALQILDGSLSPTDDVIPHGTVKEITLLDPREVKRNSGTNDSVAPSNNYNRHVRDRQPLEIRATVLDLGLLRTKTIGNATPSQEYLLPNSGIIYATRDDALPDASAGNTESAKLVSPVDFILDATRRPNAIMLVNGEKLGRTDTYRDVEKGLILATNLPVYIKGDFNKHTQEEFDEELEPSWDNFYTRETLNPNFACRKNDPRLPGCDPGDDWRPATVLADAVTLLSNTFKEGFRAQGDYDWSQQPLTSVPSGFSRFNNFVTQADWPTIKQEGSSYLNNFVTPIVLRTVPGAYLTEACVIPNPLPTGQTEDSYCNQPGNWRIQINNSCNDVGQKNNNPQYLHENIIGDTSGVTETNVSDKIKTGFIFQEFEELKTKDTGNGNCFQNNKVIRRLAFLRNTDGTLVQPLKVLAVAKANGNVGTVQVFDFGAETASNGAELMPPPNNAYVSMPWLKPNSDNTAYLPVLQITQPFATPADPNNTNKIGGADTTRQDTNRWLQPAGTDTTFNLIVAAGDSPARPSEDNGGLHNFVRFMENWQPPTSITRQAIISGSFMQVKKSAYATGPYNGASANGYAIDIDGGRGTGFLPPGRQWGYDVALLSQAPDLFAQKLVLTPPDLPDEYFREVGRSDKWVKTLLCAKKADGTRAVPNSCQS